MTLLRAAALSYVVATALGVAMRFQLAGVPLAIPFDHLLHAHSHILYFGWVGLAVWGLALERARSRGVTRAVVAAAWTVPPMGLGFLLWGYAPLTIAVSTLTMLLWYAAVSSWLRLTRGDARPGIPHLRAGFAYVGVASLGVWALAWLRASGWGTPLAESLAVHAFLTAFGWFFVMAVVGLLCLHRDRLAISLPAPALRRALAWWIPLAWLTFPLGVTAGPEVPWLGAAARAAGLLLVYPAWLLVSALWRAPRPRTDRATGWTVRAMAVWFALHTALPAAVALAGSPALVAAGRQGVVVALHATLVGFVTTGLVLVGLSSAHRGTLLKSHTAALALMLAALAAAGVGSTGPGLAGAAAAAVGLWLAGLGWARRFGLPDLQQHPTSREEEAVR